MDGEAKCLLILLFCHPLPLQAKGCEIKIVDRDGVRKERRRRGVLGRLVEEEAATVAFFTAGAVAFFAAATSFSADVAERLV